MTELKKNQSSAMFTVSLLKTNQKSCCSLVETLEKDLAILQIEVRHGLRISSELEKKREWFNQISNALLSKLQSLWSLAEAYSYENNEIKEFTDKISSSWINANKQICKEYAKIRVASRTMSGTPLSVLLDKIRKQAAAVKVSLQIGEVMYDQKYVIKGYSIFNEIMKLLRSLDRCDDKVQQYLAICKMVPYLLELESTVDRFVSTTELLPVSKTISSNLTVFLIVARLLTGDLLAEESINPNLVLTDNAPRKPVFIVKNNKRKMDIPTMPAMKMMKSSSYLSSLQ